MESLSLFGVELGLLLGQHVRNLDRLSGGALLSPLLLGDEPPTLGEYMKLLVRNLDRSTNEKELAELFQEFGAVQYCTITIDQISGLSKGFGFVEMPRVGDAKAAMKNLNNRTVGGNKIRVKKAEGKSTQGPEQEAQ